MHPFLKGLPKYLEPAINEAFIEKVGQISSLEIISGKLEAYLKKVTILGKGQSFNDSNKGLIPLYKMLELNSSLSNQTKNGYPQLKECNLPSFQGKQEYLYSLCYTRLIRNTVHNAEDFTQLDVLDRRNHVLVVYLYATLLHYNSIVEQITVDLQVKSQKYNDNNEKAMLYDFFTFSKTTNSIREQIISSSILHFLNKEGASGLKDIMDNSNKYFDRNMNKYSYEQIIRKLENKKKIEKSNLEYSLTTKEQDRINRAQEDFSENEEAFLASFQELTMEHGINDHSSDFLEKTKEFLESNYSIDCYEILNKGVDITKDENQLSKNYVEYIKGIIENPNQVNEVIVDVLELCESNDFLLRISASQIFTQLTNSKEFQHYVQQTKRIVLLDTQIVLYALMYEIEQDIGADYDHNLYAIVKELVFLSKRNETIELEFSPHYIDEVSYQLKRALTLIPYDAITDSTVKLSNNVFYEFYWWLKKENHLDQEYSLEDYMSDYFYLYESDFYKDDFRNLVRENVYKLLERIGISVVKVPRYPQEQLNRAIKILEESLSESRNKAKPHVVLKNDALMVCYLSDTKKNT